MLCIRKTSHGRHGVSSQGNSTVCSIASSRLTTKNIKVPHNWPFLMGISIAVSSNARMCTFNNWTKPETRHAKLLTSCQTLWLHLPNRLSSMSFCYFEYLQTRPYTCIIYCKDFDVCSLQEHLTRVMLIFLVKAFFLPINDTQNVIVMDDDANDCGKVITKMIIQYKKRRNQQKSIFIAFIT